MLALQFTTEHGLAISLVDSGIRVSEHSVEAPDSAHATGEHNDTHDRVSLNKRLTVNNRGMYK